MLLRGDSLTADRTRGGGAMLRTGTFLLESIFSGVFLWLGLYLITRDSPGDGRSARRWWQRPALATGVALLCVASYLLGLAIQVISDDPSELVLWLRLTWWTIPLACPAIFHGIFLVTAHAGRSPRMHLAGNIASVLLSAYALCLAIGTVVTTNLFYQVEAVRRVQRPPYYLEVPPRFPLYALPIVLVIGTLLAVTFLLFRRYYADWNEPQKQFRWLGSGVALQALGAAVGYLGFISQQFPPELGDALLVGGLFLMGYGVAHHNALLQHRVVTRDFYRSLASAAVTSVLFVLVFVGVHALTPSALTPESIPLLIWLAILAVTLRPWVGTHLDRIFLPPKTAAIREVVTRVNDDLVTAEDPQRAVLAMEREMPERIKAISLELDLRDLQEAITRDIAKLLSGTNYKRADSGDLIARETGLLELAVVEDTITTLMKRDGLSPTIDRDHYRLRALRQIIRDLVEDLGADVPKTDVQGDEYRHRRGQFLILRRQFLDGVPRKEVEMIVKKELGIAPGGSYGRLLGHAKTELARRLYLEERLARETRERGRQRGAA